MALRITTTASIENRLSMLAAHSDEEIRSVSVHDMRALLRDVGVHHVTRDGVPVPIRSSRREELQVELVGLALKQRALASAVIPQPDEVPTAPPASVVVELPNIPVLAAEFKRLAQCSMTECNHTTSHMAHNFIKQVALAYPDTSEQLRFNVRCARRTDYFRDMRDAIGSDESAERVFSMFREKALEFGKEDSIRKRASNEAKTDTLIENCLPVRTRALREWCEAQLTSLGSGTPITKWKEITVALALVTGRRMNEVLALTEYEVVGEYSINCYNLSKGKDGDAPVVEGITTLAPAELVVRAIEWLNPKRVNDRELVNKRYGKELSGLMKELVDGFNVVDEDKRFEVKGGREIATINFHALRKLYVLNCMTSLAHLSEVDMNKEAARLLGHENWRTTTYKYKEVFTLVD